MNIHLFRSCFAVVILVLAAAGDSAAHPGKTDYRDGHQCLKNCEDWDLGYEEYHLHDRDRNAILLGDRKVRSPRPREAMETGSGQTLNPAAAGTDVQEQVEKKPAPQTVVRQEYTMVVREESLFSWTDMLLAVLAGLLLLVLASLRRRNQKE